MDWKKKFPIEWDKESGTVMLNGVCINDAEDAKQASEDLNLAIRLILEDLAKEMIEDSPKWLYSITWKAGYETKRQELITTAFKWKLNIK